MSFRRWLVLIPGLYLAALITPAFGPSPGALRGFWCLILVPMTAMAPPWWANPALFIAYALFAGQRIEWAAVWGIIAVLLMVSALPLWGVSQLGPGFWLWLASAVALVAAAINLRWRSHKWTGGDITAL